MIDDAFNRLEAVLDHSGCGKKRVAAGGWLSENGCIPQWIFATNSCKHTGLHCPRLDMPSGEGYHLCEAKHAEIALIEKYYEFEKNAGDFCHIKTVYIYGHYYACESCASALKAIGVEQLIIREK